MPKIGFKHSEESRLKMSNSKLGCVPWNKGKKGLQIAWNKGIPISKEAREKNRLAHLGRKLSEEHRNKIRLSMQGINAGVKNPMYGKHPIMEFKKGDKRIVGKNNPNWRGGISFYRISKNKGMGHFTPHTLETRLKISLSKRGKRIKSYTKSAEHIEKIRNGLRKGKFISCVVCGKTFFVSPINIIRGKKYCSRKCMGLNNRKEKNVNWKGGTSRIYKDGYGSVEYKQWRRDVFVRDEYTCQKCGVKHVYITAHHIKPFAFYPDLRFDINNGITLCEECHCKVDRYRAKFKKEKNYVCTGK